MVTQREREKVASSDDSVRSKINTNSIFDSSAPSASAPLPSIINIVRVFLKKDEEREASKDVWWSFQSVCLFVPLSFHSSLAINHSKKKGKFSFFLRSTWNPTGERYRTWEKAGQVLRTRESNRNSRSRAAPPVRPPHYNLSWNTLGESYHCATFSIRRDVALFTQGVSPLQNQYKRVFFFRNYSSQHNLLTYWESAVRTEFHFFCARLGAPEWRRQCQAALRERVFTRFLNFPLRKKKKKRVSYERSKYLWRNTCSFSIYIACTIFLSRGAFYFQYFVMGEKRIEGLNGS